MRQEEAHDAVLFQEVEAVEPKGEVQHSGKPSLLPEVASWQSSVTMPE